MRCRSIKSVKLTLPEYQLRANTAQLVVNVGHSLLCFSKRSLSLGDSLMLLDQPIRQIALQLRVGRYGCTRRRLSLKPGKHSLVPIPHSLGCLSIDVGHAVTSTSIGTSLSNVARLEELSSDLSNTTGLSHEPPGLAV